MTATINLLKQEIELLKAEVAIANASKEHFESKYKTTLNRFGDYEDAYISIQNEAKKIIASKKEDLDLRCQLIHDINRLSRERDHLVNNADKLFTQLDNNSINSTTAIIVWNECKNTHHI